MNSVTIGMAGHIDHGKTALTRALTGMETDRLEEEKSRGLSIENGFAYFNLDKKTKIGIIDVPGHEKLIRQMIAASAGVDGAILVVAGDEGIMPQTIEHLEILKLLGLSDLIVAVTKVTGLDDDWLDSIEEDISGMLADYGYEEAVIHRVDSLAKTGLGPLKESIRALLKDNKKAEQGNFRLPIDSAFSLKGYGTIIRGTVYDGGVRKDDILQILPSGAKVRVKGLQVHYETRDEARAGERVALNIDHLKAHEVKRGDTAVTPDSLKSSRRLDVCLNMIRKMKTPLKQRMQVLFHSATIKASAIWVFFDRNRTEGETSVFGQLIFDQPLALKKGDRFIIRHITPAETIGGGKIIDPAAEKHPFGEKTINGLKAKADKNPTDNVDEKDEKQAAAIRTLKETLEKFHANYPWEAGMNIEQWRQAVCDPKLRKLAEEEMRKAGQVIFDKGYAALSHFEVSLPDKWQKGYKRLEEKLDDEQCLTESFRALFSHTQLPEKAFGPLKSYTVRAAGFAEIADDWLMSRRFEQCLTRQLREKTGENFTVQDAKPALGLSRKKAIQFLEYLDRQSLTIRVGNERKWLNKNKD